MKTEDADPLEHVENKTKVAKYFEDEKTGKQRLFRGVVDGYKQKNKYWHITFEVLYVPTRLFLLPLPSSTCIFVNAFSKDGDEEDFNRKELDDAIHLFEEVYMRQLVVYKGGKGEST